ncbi:hypothetical protein C1H76_9678 [Elsinoe australis]|uniref:Uncharacterized protein n=1 Tax=Elsinoe australis TaxID=40998 RepID=A0A4U7AMZ4_9PEZI|nr:hypothetical protein C1H76_9678 [Elsinoe australis]
MSDFQSPISTFSSLPWSSDSPHFATTRPITADPSDLTPEHQTFDHSTIHVQAGALGLDFPKIPACFAPLGSVPVSTNTASCMDHPDIPSDFLRLKNKKKSKASDSKHSTSSKSNSASKTSSTAKVRPSEPRHASSSSKQSWTAPEPYQQQVETQSMISESKGFGYSWNVRSSQESGGGPGRKLSLLSSRKPKPQNLKEVPQKRPDEALSHKLLTAKHPDLSNVMELGIKEPIFPSQPLSPLEEPRMLHQRTDSSSISSQPGTPSWMDRGQRRYDEQMRYTQPQQPSQNAQPGQPPNIHTQQYPQGYPQQYVPQQHISQEQFDPEMALFAAATSGLSPDRQQNRWTAEQPPLPPIPSSHQHYPSTASQRHHSTSSSSAYSVPVVSDPQPRPGESQEALRAYHTLTGLPKSVPDLPATRNPPANSFPPGHPLARWTTQSSYSSRGSSESARASSYEAPHPPRPDQQPSRSLDVHRPLVSPLTPENMHRPVSPISPEHTTQSHPSYSSSESRPSMQHSRSLDMPRVPSRPVSPNQDSDAAWMQRNVSALTLNTTVSPSSAIGRDDVRNSMVSAISPCDVSPIDENDVLGADGALSPLDDDELPDYKTSQVEQQFRRQRENERRAEELRRRWEASTGR